MLLIVSYFRLILIFNELWMKMVLCVTWWNLQPFRNQNRNKSSTGKSSTHAVNANGCDFCNKQYNTIETHKWLSTFWLSMHNWRIHSHQCHLCDMKYLLAYSLNDRIRAVHTQDRLFKCEVEGCGKISTRSSTYRSHRKVYDPDKYDCDNFCPKQFSVSKQM